MDQEETFFAKNLFLPVSTYANQQQSQTTKQKKNEKNLIFKLSVV